MTVWPARFRGRDGRGCAGLVGRPRAQRRHHPDRRHHQTRLRLAADRHGRGRVRRGTVRPPGPGRAMTGWPPGGAHEHAGRRRQADARVHPAHAGRECPVQRAKRGPRQAKAAERKAPGPTRTAAPRGRTARGRFTTPGPGEGRPNAPCLLPRTVQKTMLGGRGGLSRGRLRMILRTRRVNHAGIAVNAAKDR